MYLCKYLNRKRLAVSQDTIEMKDYKETLSKFNEDYYKNLVANNVQEKVERYNEIGQVCRVSLRWRGKYYHLQLFFPGSKFPSRKEVEAQVHKVYPDAVVMVHYSSESNPNQPLVRVAEGTKYVNPNNDRNEFGLPKGLKGATIKTPKELDKKLDRTGLAQSYEVEGENLQELDNMGGPAAIGAVVTAGAGLAKAGFDAVNKVRKNLQKKTQQKNKILNQETEVEGDKLNEKTKYYKGNPKGTPKKPEAGDRRPGVKEDVNFVEFMKRVEKLPEVTRDSIKELGDDPQVAKAALEISGMDK